jgi:hypothetical protein
MERKVCTKCNVEKPLDEFYYRKDTNRFESRCCECCKTYRKLRYENNSNYHKEYQKNNRDKINNYAKSWRKNNPGKSVEYTLKWRDSNREKYNQYQKLSRTNGSLIQLSSNIRNRINKFLKIKNITKRNRTFEIVGCTPELLKEHLEKHFKMGMSWENRNEWHIDHIIPLSSAKTEKEFYKLCHYTNLQPLWAEENIKKSNKLLKTI